MLNKSIIFPDRIRELWPKVKSQAALDNLDIGEFVTKALEAALNPDSSLEDDIDYVLELESINEAIFKDHPELLKAVVDHFDYDHSDYNDAIMDTLKEQCRELKINLEDYQS